MIVPSFIRKYRKIKMENIWKITESDYPGEIPMKNPMGNLKPILKMLQQEIDLTTLFLPMESIKNLVESIIHLGIFLEYFDR